MCTELSSIFSPLNIFIGRKVFINNPDKNVSFVYESFQMDIEMYENYCVMYDGNNKDSKTFIPTFGLDGVKSSSEDVYENVVEIDSTHYNYYIACLDKKPILPTCKRCGKDLDKFDEHVWYVKQRAGYYSPRDGQEINIEICDNCFEEVFGSLIPEIEEVGECDE